MFKLIRFSIVVNKAIDEKGVLHNYSHIENPIHWVFEAQEMYFYVVKETLYRK